MEYLFTFIVIIALSLLLCITTLKPGNAQGHAAPATISQVTETSQARPPLTRQEIEQKLKILAASKTPEKLSMGAMCYKVAAPPDRADYTCPKCGSRTLYSSSDGAYGRTGFINNSLPAMRRMAQDMKGLTLVLDEAEFCRKCSPAVKSPELKLTVKYPGKDKAVTTGNITLDDMTLLSEFMEGKNRHAGGQGSETALKQHLPRLEQLLGIPLQGGK
jgi:hypothetical protein